MEEEILRTPEGGLSKRIDSLYVRRGIIISPDGKEEPFVTLHLPIMEGKEVHCVLYHGGLMESVTGTLTDLLPVLSTEEIALLTSILNPVEKQVIN